MFLFSVNWDKIHENDYIGVGNKKGKILATFYFIIFLNSTF